MFLNKDDLEELPQKPNTDVEEEEKVDYTWQELGTLTGIKIQAKEELDKEVKPQKVEFQKLRMFDSKIVNKAEIGKKFWTPKGYGTVTSVEGGLVQLTNKAENLFKVDDSEVFNMINIHVMIYSQEISGILGIKMNIHRTFKELIAKICAILNMKPSGQLFFNKVKLDPKQTIVHMNIQDGDKIIYEHGMGGEFKRFHRFGEDHSSTWCTGIYIYIYIYIGESSWDAITYIAQMPMTILGFACYSPSDSSSTVTLHYKIQLNSKQIMEKTVNLPRKGGESQKILDVIFADEDSLEVEANAKITIIQALHHSQCWQGKNGNDYQNRKENEKGAFKIESSSEDHNCTCQDYGQIPQILYSN